MHLRAASSLRYTSPPSSSQPGLPSVIVPHFQGNRPQTTPPKRISILPSLTLLLTLLSPLGLPSPLSVIAKQQEDPTAQISEKSALPPLPHPRHQKEDKERRLLLNEYAKEDYPQVLKFLESAFPKGARIFVERMTQNYIDLLIWSPEFPLTSRHGNGLRGGMRLERKFLTPDQLENQILTPYRQHADKNIIFSSDISVDEPTFLQKINEASADQIKSLTHESYVPLTVKKSDRKEHHLYFVTIQHPGKPEAGFRLDILAPSRKLEALAKKLNISISKPTERDADPHLRFRNPTPDSFPKVPQRNFIEYELDKLEEKINQNMEEPASTAQQPDKPIVETPPKGILPKLPSPYLNTEDHQSKLLFYSYEEKHYPRVLKFLNSAFQQKVPISVNQITKDYIDLIIESPELPLEHSTLGLQLRGGGIRLEKRFLTPEQIENDILKPYYQSAANENVLFDTDIAVDEFTFLEKMKSSPKDRIKALTHQIYTIPPGKNKYHRYVLITEYSKDLEAGFYLMSGISPSKKVEQLAKKLNISVIKPYKRPLDPHFYERYGKKLSDLASVMNPQ